MNSNKRKGGAEKIREKKMKLLATVGKKCTKMYDFFKVKNDIYNSSSNKELTESTGNY